MTVSYTHLDVYKRQLSVLSDFLLLVRAKIFVFLKLKVGPACFVCFVRDVLFSCFATDSLCSRTR